jgi:ABC-type glycerol-3-phosphate transport system permease component
MVLVIALNAILAFGVIAMVISPLVWAILTQHRDSPELARYGRRRPQLALQPARDNRTERYEPVARPA